MSILDQIKVDREGGTPGEWDATQTPDLFMFVCEKQDHSNVICEVHTHRGPDCRRIARVPQLESMALAAEELASAIEDDTGTFEDERRIGRAHVAFREACK